MFTSALVTIAKTWKQPNCTLTDEWISQMLYIHIIEYYLALKRKKILTYAISWMNLEDIMLRVSVVQDEKRSGGDW